MLKINHLEVKLSKFTVKVEDLELKMGEVVGLVGANGAGKTTVIKSIVREIHSPLTDIEFKGPDNYFEKMSYVPDGIRLEGLSIDEYLQVYSNAYKNFNLELARNLIADIDLDFSEKTSRLSLGESQKLMMCMAKAIPAELYIFDEPSDGYDYSSLVRLRDDIYDMSTDNNLFIISTHQIKFYENILDRILYLKNGDILYNITSIDLNDKGLEILKENETKQEYIDVFKERPSFDNLLIALEKGRY